jgi:O-antigen ligase
MDSYPNYGGLSHKLDDVKVASAIVIAFAILYVISILVESRLTRGDEDKIRKNKRVLVITGVAVVLLGITAFVLYGIKRGDSLFRFNYKWGTYRGYIWAKCAETFKNAPIANKLFGYGNETIKQVVTVPNYDDMVEKTSRIYDNAHNEVLQYLLTLGLFGALSYIALVVSSIWYMCRYGSKNLHTYIPAFVVCGYFVQGLVNLNQPITTPLFFVFLGVGIGYASYCKNH